MRKKAMQIASLMTFGLLCFVLFIFISSINDGNEYWYGYVVSIVILVMSLFYQLRESNR